MNEMNNPNGAEKREFRMHKDILWSIIKSQAGTIGKAVLELVMNSIDAGATKVKVELSATCLAVSDDGKGFQSREEVEQWFETFGTPHQKGDATYGRFRMGRGQVMAFTRNRWRSGQFAMNVDIRDLGLAYELTTEKALHKGCQIEGELYDTLQPSELIRVTDNLRDLCKYAPIPIFVNGDRVSVDLGKEKWTFEDEDAYYLLRQHARKLEVYNLGVHVRDYFSDYGIGGIVVSKQQLEVNFARNDILVSECQVWKRVAAKVRAHARSMEEKKPTQNDAYRDLTMARMLSGSFDTVVELLKAIDEAKVFTDYGGKHHSLSSLYRTVHGFGGLISVPEEMSLKADKVHQHKLALVISPKTIERAQHMSLPAVLKRIGDNLRQFGGGGHEAQRALRTIDELGTMLVPLAQVSSMINDVHTLVEDSKLSKDERIVLRVLRDMSYKYLGIVPASGEIREVKVCESETVDGYTDGSTTIFVERKLLKIGGAAGHVFKGFGKLNALMLHEYLHNESDATGHGHPQEFYQAFHDISQSDRFQSIAYDAVMRYLALRRKAGIKMRAGDLHALDMIAMEDEAAEAPKAHPLEATVATVREPSPPAPLATNEAQLSLVA